MDKKAVVHIHNGVSRFDARYWMLGAGALGRLRGMVWGMKTRVVNLHFYINLVLYIYSQRFFRFFNLFSKKIILMCREVVYNRDTGSVMCKMKKADSLYRKLVINSRKSKLLA